MIVTLDTAPAVEPISLAEAKEHIRLDGGTFAEDITTSQTLVPDAWAAGTHDGTGIDVSGSDVLVNLDVGTVTATCTVDAVIQESDDDSTYTDWGTAFAQVTTANDNTLYEKAYTGTKQYIRVRAVVANDAGDFSASVIEGAATSTEDTYITDLITMAREWVESYTRRALINQTWLMYLDAWPSGDAITLPFGNVSTVTHVKYTESDDTQNTWSSSEYDVDTDSILGRIVLGYGESFPSFTARPMNPIEVKWVCGYGAAATNVPEPIRAAIRILLADYYEFRESGIAGTIFTKTGNAERILYPYRIFTL